MAAIDLITLARAKQDIQSITDTSQDALLTTLITAVSDAIEKYCLRRFLATRRPFRCPDCGEPVTTS